MSDSPLELMYLIKRVVSNLLLPPFGLFVLGFFLLLFVQRKPGRRLAFGMSVLCLVSGLFLSTHWASGRLIAWVEGLAGPVLTIEAAKNLLGSPSPPQAVVILAGGLVYDEREPGGPVTPSINSLQRTLYGTRLAKQMGLKVLLSGGVPPSYAVAEAQAMAQVMSVDLGLKPEWLETISKDTFGNAQESAKILLPIGVKHVVLVTQAAHMLRSRIEFERAGFKVTVAPMGFQAGQGSPSTMLWLPSPSGAVKAGYAVHELVGLLWYRLKSLQS